MQLVRTELTTEPKQSDSRVHALNHCTILLLKLTAPAAPNRAKRVERVQELGGIPGPEEEQGHRE